MPTTRCSANYPESDYVWTQDGAPLHTASKCQEFCTIKMANFLVKEIWPSSSSDLDPLDNGVWSTLEKETNKIFLSNVDSLKDAIVAEWDKLSKSSSSCLQGLSTSCAGCN
ncbi:Uncharacterized protein FKW44_015925 [Caligus rogercresseyi]|uniref:Uncharacterized protein n=1 Tax=Caligus rogercresseyi TaxID=217165 RepID=A0A7T8H105_CALRO|nr:Uncharacterized protein FKW44_015925 [Caligus rogercresseyi]